jgi:hypothetical protein
MLRRAGFMLRYNDSGATEWPLGTSQAPIVSRTAGYGSSVRLADDAQPGLLKTPTELLSQLEAKSRNARFNLSADGSSLSVAADDSRFGVQFATSPLDVRAGTDYILRTRLSVAHAPVALKMTDFSAVITLSSTIIESASRKSERKKTRKAQALAELSRAAEEGLEEDWVRVDLPFASGNGTQVRLALVNDRRESGAAPVVSMQKVELFEVGPTPHKQLDGLRVAVRGLQKNLFTTSVMTPLWLAGIMLLIFAREWKPAVALISVPLYYLCFQSALHTEYRYIIAIHYFLFVLAGLMLYIVGSVIAAAAKTSLSTVIQRRAKRDPATG